MNLRIRLWPTTLVAQLAIYEPPQESPEPEQLQLPGVSWDDYEETGRRRGW